MTETVPFDLDLLKILVCPKTRGPLTFNADSYELFSKQAKLAFPIKNGIPVLLIDQARPLKEDESP